MPYARIKPKIRYLGLYSSVCKYGSIVISLYLTFFENNFANLGGLALMIIVRLIFIFCLCKYVLLFGARFISFDKLDSK